MCMLAGCDYLPSVPGLGIKTAHRLVRQHRTPERLLRALAAGSAGLPEASVLPPRFVERYRHARLAFRHQVKRARAHSGAILRRISGAQFSLTRHAHPLPQAVSWFAVGCYYQLVADFENARRYFSKATSLNHRFAPAWVGFGHAFAAQDESDQAMAAYRTASRLFPGSHVPWLGIGMEYLRTNHIDLALQYIKEAEQLRPDEPLVLHELGVLHFHKGEYSNAVRCFLQVAEGSPHHDDAAREPSVFNLGHAYRKLRDFDSAAKWYRVALSINPRLASTYSALGLTLHLRGDVHAAIELYHQALSLKPDDTFTCEMLTEALKDLDEAVDPTQLGFGPPTGGVAGGAGASGAAVSMEE